MRPLAWLLRVVMLPWGVRRKGPADRTTHACAELLMQPGATRDRLTPGVFVSRPDEGLGRVEQRSRSYTKWRRSKRKVRAAGYGNDWPGAVVARVLTQGEAARLVETDAAVRAAIAVDDFPPHGWPRSLPPAPTMPGGASIANRQPTRSRTAWLAQSM